MISKYRYINIGFIFCSDFSSPTILARDLPTPIQVRDRNHGTTVLPPEVPQQWGRTSLGTALFKSSFNNIGKKLSKDFKEGEHKCDSHCTKTGRDRLCRIPQGPCLLPVEQVPTDPLLYNNMHPEFHLHCHTRCSILQESREPIRELETGTDQKPNRWNWNSNSNWWNQNWNRTSGTSPRDHGPGLPPDHGPRELPWTRISIKIIEKYLTC